MTIVVEPSPFGAVVDGPLASGTAFGEQAAQLSIRLRITNNNKAEGVVVNTIAMSFVPPRLVDPVAISVNLSIDPGELKWLNFATADNIIMPDPPQPPLTVSARRNEFSDPATVVLPLDRHTNLVMGWAYLFPARAQDLLDGEFRQGGGAAHSPAGGEISQVSRSHTHKEIPADLNVQLVLDNYRTRKTRLTQYPAAHNADPKACVWVNSDDVIIETIASFALLSSAGGRGSCGTRRTDWQA